MGSGNSSRYNNTIGSLISDYLIEELRNSGVKFTESDIVMITKTKKGELVWLEKGNQYAGLQHIISRHEQDFKNKFGILKHNIPSFIKEVFSDDIEIKSIKKGNGVEKIFLYNQQYIILSGVGNNGFIVTMYPLKMKGI